MLPLEELIEFILNGKAIEGLHRKRMYCSHCDKTWIELVGHIIRRRQKDEDIHLRIGSDTPCQCIDCGCALVFEVSLPTEIEDTKDLSFKDIKIVGRNDLNPK